MKVQYSYTKAPPNPTCTHTNTASHSNIYIHLSPFFYLLSSTPISSLWQAPKTPQAPTISSQTPETHSKLKKKKKLVYIFKNEWIRECLILFNSNCHILHCLFIHKSLLIHLPRKYSHGISAFFFPKCSQKQSHPVESQQLTQNRISTISLDFSLF